MKPEKKPELIGVWLCAIRRPVVASVWALAVKPKLADCIHRIEDVPDGVQHIGVGVRDLLREDPSIGPVVDRGLRIVKRKRRNPNIPGLSKADLAV